jgi:hypothetical protein
MVKKILLSQGKVALVDDVDFECLNQYKWYVKKESQAYYACRHGSRKKEPRPFYRMHRCITNAPKGMEVDHINGDGLDNRRSNLRIVTHRQNCQNQQYKKITSKYPGVCWHKASDKWAAAISINGKPKHLGLFKTELEAFEVYKRALNKLTGEKVVCEVQVGGL